MKMVVTTIRSKNTRRWLVATAVILTISSNATAEIRQSHQCIRDGLIRMVQLTAASDSGVPCEVVYLKPSEGQPPDTLWMANNDATFCKLKYDAFIIKLESKLNWLCEPIDVNQPVVSKSVLPDNETRLAESASDADSATPIISPEALGLTHAGTRIGTGTGTGTGTEAEAEAEAETEAKAKLVAIHGSIEKKPQPISPSLSAALPADNTDANTQSHFGLDLIRSFFPTGYYKASTDFPHTGDRSLCPTDGFYIWNTQQPDKPAFEMGRNLPFIFNLSQFTNQARTIATGGSPAAPCNYRIQSSYCMDNQLAGGPGNSGYPANSLNCRAASGSSDPVRALALISELTTSVIPEACLADAPPKMMGLASLGKTSSGAAPAGFELAIERSDGSSISRASCRYVRGR